MNASLYIIECLTNLHVGSGDENYSVIDKEVEKDYVTGLPVIHSSGVKGSLKNHFETIWKNDTVKQAVIANVFGQSANGESTSGQYRFLSAQLLARPLRVSSGKTSYINVTTPEILNDYMDMCRSFHIKSYTGQEDIPRFDGTSKFLTAADIDTVEGLECSKEYKSEYLSQLIGSYWGMTSVQKLKEFSLPIIARNRLDENSISTHLWYEEYVPHKSLFYFFILTPDHENLLDGELNGKIVQLGGNASIGYGLCKFRKVGESA